MDGRRASVALIGAAILLISVYLWGLEGPGGYHLHPEEEEAK